jgi:hypothetical protein
MLPFPMLSSTSASAPRSPRPSSLCALRISAFRSLPSSFNVKLSTFNCLPPRSPHQCHSMGVTSPLFSYSYALFCTARNTNSFRFIFFHTLCSKHPGWGIPCFSTASALKIAPCRRPLKSELVSYCQLSAVSCQPLFLFSPGATTTPATAPLFPLVTILDAVDAPSSISPAFATLTKNTRGWGPIQLSTSRPERRRRVNRQLLSALKEATQRPLAKNAKIPPGGDTVSTEAVAARRHAGTHLPVTWWKLEMPTTTWHLLLN